MKQIDREKFQKKLERVRLQFSMTFFGEKLELPQRNGERRKVL